ncbi:MAG: hypothetical protein WC707_01030 [Candidatus Babeliaceae bacterium]|jgi:dihydrofolate synthase/folylpolyglutamate synthase
MDITKQAVGKTAATIAKQRSYSEVVDYLDKHWNVNKDSKTLDRIKKLDAAFGSLSQKTNAIIIGGTNGKSLTMHFTARLFQEENLKVGAFYSPHILTYNERLTINNEAVSNKLFTEIGNEVINMAETLKIDAYSHELLTMMALVYFNQNNVDVALLETHNGGLYDATNVCHAKVVSITRVTSQNVLATEESMKVAAQDIMGIVKKDTHIVSGDQSKAMLQLMQSLTEAQGGIWAMPIRKLAALTYPFEQLHGRCAALAERIAELYSEHFINKNSTILSGTLLSKPKSARGRPTLDEKRKRDINPEKTFEKFWKEVSNELPGRFQILDKEKPTVLLDTANNIDAFKNLLLGIRLLHYQRPLKGLTIVVGAAFNKMHSEEFLKLVRYFFKKTSGQIFICPITDPIAGLDEDTSWDVEQVTNDIKSMKIKARACKSFEEAFELAKKSVDERNGLLVITGSHSIVNHYWRLKGIKKF